MGSRLVVLLHICDSDHHWVWEQLIIVFRHDAMMIIMVTEPFAIIIIHHHHHHHCH